MFNDPISIVGEIRAELFAADGSLKEIVEVPNLVVKTGKDFIASRMVGTAKAIMSHMAIGIGSTGALDGDLTLGNEAARVVLTSSTVGATPNENIVTYVATFGPSVPGVSSAITEAGIFNDGTAGDMLCRTTFGVITKGVDDTLTITWTITITV